MPDRRKTKANIQSALIEKNSLGMCGMTATELIDWSKIDYCALQHENFAGVLFCGLVIFCGLREQIFAVRDD